MERILPIVVRDLHRQLDDITTPASCGRWSIALSWDGHSLFDDGQFVREGFRFDAYVEVLPEAAR